jgi:prepilin-type N-terminal cleavage/methylation domain-containing protein
MKKRNRLHHKAFTLIELLVVIAIIALLLAILMPALSMAKKKAATAVCLVNTRNLSLAWYMYAQENDGKIMSAQMENVGAETECRVGWIGQPHTATDTTSSSLTNGQTSPVTDEDEIRGVMKGKLYGWVIQIKVRSENLLKYSHLLKSTISLKVANGTGGIG